MGWYQRRVHGDFEAARSRPRTDDDATPHEAKAEKRTEPIDDDRATLSRKMPRTPAKKSKKAAASAHPTYEVMIKEAIVALRTARARPPLRSRSTWRPTTSCPRPSAPPLQGPQEVRRERKAHQGQGVLQARKLEDRAKEEGREEEDRRQEEARDQEEDRRQEEGREEAKE